MNSRLLPFDEKVFLALEKEILSNYENMNIVEELFEMQKIYHRSIFDAYNASLLNVLLRRNLSFFSLLEPQKSSLKQSRSATKVLNQAKETVLDHASILCGILKDKEDSMMGNIRFMDDVFIGQLREERMYRMISLEVF